MSPKALALLSGGLDSLLAAKLIQNQGIIVTGLSFKSFFFSPVNLTKISRVNPQTPQIISDFSLSHLKIVLKPKYGYGKNMNPCLDCHLLMLKKAGKILKKQGYHFLITGEVLGQRPFSQTKKNLLLLEKESHLAGLIVRPLSQKLLPPTIPEQKGWIDREKLLSISGRSRKMQLKLAKKYKLTGFSAPGTSCILTDPQFSKRLRQMLILNPCPKANDLKLLKLGRHYQKNNCLIIIGRRHQENLDLIKLRQKGDLLLELKSFPGPTVLIRSYPHGVADFSLRSPVLNYTKKLLLSHSRHTFNKNLSEKDFKIVLKFISKPAVNP